MNIRYSRPARIDIDSAFTYIMERNPQTAMEWIDAYDTRIAQLKKFPFLGQSVDSNLLRGGQRDLRLLSFDSYIVFYYVADDDIFISRVLHKKRDLTHLLMTIEVPPYEVPE